MIPARVPINFDLSLIYRDGAYQHPRSHLRRWNLECCRTVDKKPGRVSLRKILGLTPIISFLKTARLCFIQVVTSFQQVWFSEEMFQSTFSFYKGYKIPKCNTGEEYLEYINSLPSIDVPQLYGLHSNADIT